MRSYLTLLSLLAAAQVGLAKSHENSASMASGQSKGDEVHAHQTRFHIRCGPEDEAVHSAHQIQGKNMVEVELNYNQDNMFDFKKDLASIASSSSAHGDSFDHPSAFARDMGNYE
ncbi:hypothetical protein GGI23_005495, partial [Coemansia sp. RSA 2559]